MQIFVKAIDGDTLTITTSGTVDDVKKQVEDIEGVPVELQRLAFEGKELEDGHNLAFYNVKDDATLHLSMNLEGGYFSRELFNLAEKHILFKKICRKCYCRLPPKATRCRKAKCGRTTNLRPKKGLPSWFRSDVEELWQRMNRKSNKRL